MTPEELKQILMSVLDDNGEFWNLAIEGVHNENALIVTDTEDRSKFRLSIERI